MRCRAPLFSKDFRISPNNRRVIKRGGFREVFEFANSVHRRRTDNESRRLRRGISTRKLTTHLHLSGRANSPVRQYWQKVRRQRSHGDLRSPGGNNSASPLARLFIPADQRTGTPVLPLLPPPAVGGGNISFISGSNNSTQYYPC